MLRIICFFMVKHRLEFIKSQTYKNVVLNYILLSIFFICFVGGIIYFIFERILYSDYNLLKDTVDNAILEGKSELTIYQFDKYKVNNEVTPISDYQREGSLFYVTPSTAANIDRKNIRSTSTIGAFTIWSLKKTDPSKDEYEYTELTAGAIGYKTPSFYGEQTPAELYKNALDYYLDKDFHNSRQGNGYPLTEVRPKSVAPSYMEMFLSSKYHSLKDRFKYLESGAWGSGQNGIMQYGNNYWTVYLDYSNRLLEIGPTSNVLDKYRATTFYIAIPVLIILMVIIFFLKKSKIQCIDLYWKKWYSENSDMAIVFEYNLLTQNTMTIITPESDNVGRIYLSGSNLIKFQNSLNQTSIFEIIELDNSHLVLKDTSDGRITNYEVV